MEGIRVNGTFDDVVEAAKKLDQQEEMRESKLREGNIYRSVADYIWANYNKEIREFNPTTVEDCQKFVISHIDHSRIKNKETVKGICHGASYLLLDWLGNGEGNIIDVRGQYSESKTFSHERQIFQEESNFKNIYKCKLDMHSN